MYSFSIIIILLFILSLVLNYLYLIKKQSAIEIVNDMGLGYNLGSLFDCYNESKEIKTPNEQITLRGNSPPTKETINKLNKYGFKTIMFPVTWLYFMDDSNVVNQEWMLRVREVVDWIINKNMYCILNLHNDYYSNWFSERLNSKDKFIALWKQIANEFKDYDEHLIFESMDNLEFWKENYIDFDYLSLYNLNQVFVDTIRNSGGKNIERLLLILGAMDDLKMTTSQEYKIPIDPYNKIAISIYYYEPADFTYTYDFNWVYIDDDGYEQKFETIKKWGSDYDYNEMINNFELMKKHFIDKGIPVIIGQVGVLTEEKKEKESIEDYLYFEFALSFDYNGIMSCLWDTSQKNAGDMNYYNRENDTWYDEKIKKNFKKISKGKFPRPTQYYIITNKLSSNEINSFGNLEMYIGDKNVTNIIFNVNFLDYSNKNLCYNIIGYNSIGEFISITIGEKYGKKEYDGTFTFSYDSRKIGLTQYIEIEKASNDILSQFNNLTIEFQESFMSIDVKSFKEDISFYK